MARPINIDKHQAEEARVGRMMVVNVADFFIGAWSFLFGFFRFLGSVLYLVVMVILMSAAIGGKMTDTAANLTSSIAALASLVPPWFGACVVLAWFFDRMFQDAFTSVAARSAVRKMVYGS